MAYKASAGQSFGNAFDAIRTVQGIRANNIRGIVGRGSAHMILPVGDLLEEQDCQDCERSSNLILRIWGRACPYYLYHGI